MRFWISQPGRTDSTAFRKYPACLLGVTAGAILLGCGSAVTPLRAVTAAHRQTIQTECDKVFPQLPFEATHVVEASIPLSDDVSLIGVVSAQMGNFRSMLLSQEGVVLFDAIRRGNDIQVMRAVPPIDPSGFGRNMTGDVQLILIRPPNSPTEVGITRDGVKICRWSLRGAAGEEVVEVELGAPHSAQVRRYEDGRLARTALLTAIDEQGYAHDALLKTTGMIGYQLHLTLLSAITNPGVAPANAPSANGGTGDGV